MSEDGLSLRGDVVVLDVETDGLDPYHGDRIFCFSYFTNEGEYGFMRNSPFAIEFVKALFADPTKKIVFHNAKFDLKMFTFEGVDIFNAKAQVHCTLVLAKMYNGMMSSYKLIDLAARLLNRKSKDKTDIADWVKANKREYMAVHSRAPNFRDAPVDLVKRRAMWDAESTLMLFYFLYPKVMRTCGSLYETERELSFVVVDMENTGIQVDITKAKQLRDAARAGVKLLQSRLDKLVCPLVIKRVRCTTKGCKKARKKGIKVVLTAQDMPHHCPECGCENLEIVEEEFQSFNSNSSAIQVPAAFIKMGFTLTYKTKPKKGKKGGKSTGGGRWSFDEYSMIRYSTKKMAMVIRESGEEGWTLDRFFKEIETATTEDKDYLPPLILKLNELKKLISTYYDHIIDQAVDVHVRPDGREVGVIHAHFNQSEAMTGRFSSSGPNLQNMPRILGPRECFITRVSRRNWHFDYEQVEMKFFVHHACDTDMAAAIAKDIHLYVAAEIYQKDADEVTKEQRKRAKGVNFGIIYGSGAPTMAETLTKKGLITTNSEAQILVSAYHRRFPSVRRITNEIKQQLMRQGYITNSFGRMYHLNFQKGYKGLNYKCQGDSADLMKQRMVRVWKYLRKIGSKAKIILQVHDELAIEIPPCEEAALIPKIKQLMEDPTSFFIPITVDVEVVRRRWSEKMSLYDFLKRRQISPEKWGLQAAA